MPHTKARKFCPDQDVNCCHSCSYNHFAFEANRAKTAQLVEDSLSYMIQQCEFNPRPSQSHPVEGMFCMVLTALPAALSDESINGSLISSHVHSITQAGKLPNTDIHVSRWMLATKAYPACIFHEDRMRLPLWLEKKKPNLFHKNFTQSGETAKTQRSIRDCWRTWQRKEHRITLGQMLPLITHYAQLC